MIPIRSVCLARYLHIVEHALEFLSELETALDLELGKHASLSIVRDRSAL